MTTENVFCFKTKIVISMNSIEAKIYLQYHRSKKNIGCSKKKSRTIYCNNIAYYRTEQHIHTCINKYLRPVYEEIYNRNIVRPLLRDCGNNILAADEEQQNQWRKLKVHLLKKNPLQHNDPSLILTATCEIKYRKDHAGWF